MAIYNCAYCEDACNNLDSMTQRNGKWFDTEFCAKLYFDYKTMHAEEFFRLNELIDTSKENKEAP